MGFWGNRGHNPRDPPAKPPTCCACFSRIESRRAADDSIRTLRTADRFQPQALGRTAGRSRAGTLTAPDRDRSAWTHPHEPSAGTFQSEVAHLLRSLLSAGRVITECPLSTSDGVKALDVAWLRPGRAQELRSTTCLVRAPQICVEVLSVSNTPAEIAEKIALYFEAGAQEVWTCDLDGTMEFHFSTPPEVRQVSEICPKFPSVIRFSGE